jgi:hypothetical protein
MEWKFAEVTDWYNNGYWYEVGEFLQELSFALHLFE